MGESNDEQFEKFCDKEMESQLANLKNELKSLEETLDKKNTEFQEKEKEFQGKDSIIKGNEEIIKGKEEIIQGKDKEIQGKNIMIEGLKGVIQGKEETIQRKDKEIQEKDSTIKKLEEEIKNIKETNNINKEKDDEINQKGNGVIKENDNETNIQEKNNEIKVNGEDNVIKVNGEDNVIKENEEDNAVKENGEDNVVKENGEDNVVKENGEDNVAKENEEDNVVKENNEETKIQELVREIHKRDKIIKDLEQDNNNLRDEAVKYQGKLGAATNFRLPDNDKNNSVTLADDIKSLQNSLEDYITKCKGSIITEIDINGIQNLLIKYGSKTIITIDQKPLIKAVLKRHVIEKILECANGYFENQNANDLEVIMKKKGRDLVNLAKDFAEQRDGVDETTKALSIKLRQQICAALGNRGFNDVIFINKNSTTSHEFIRKNMYYLNKEINKYRKLNPEKKKEIGEIENMAGDIIRKVVTLFYFRLNVQEPIADRFWFIYGDKIDPNSMEGKWEDTNIDSIFVDICYFPLIANKSTRQIYTPAKIMHMQLTNVDNSSESSKQTESKE